MPDYLVKCRGQVDETYIVTAESKEDAMKNWFNGELINGEAWDVGPESAELME